MLWPRETHADALPEQAEYTRATCSGVFDHSAQAHSPFEERGHIFETHGTLGAFVAHTRHICL